MAASTEVIEITQLTNEQLDSLIETSTNWIELFRTKKKHAHVKAKLRHHIHVLTVCRELKKLRKMFQEVSITAAKIEANLKG